MLCVTGSPGIPLYVSVKVVVMNDVRLEQAQVPARQQLSGGVARPPVQRRPFTAMWDYAIPSE